MKNLAKDDILPAPHNPEGIGAGSQDQTLIKES
jgi:hypothetical protein